MQSWGPTHESARQHWRCLAPAMDGWNTWELEMGRWRGEEIFSFWLPSFFLFVQDMQLFPCLTSALEKRERDGWNGAQAWENKNLMWQISDLSSRFRTKTKVWKRVLKWRGLSSPFLYFSLVTFCIFCPYLRSSFGARQCSITCL